MHNFCRSNGGEYCRNERIFFVLIFVVMLGFHGAACPVMALEPTSGSVTCNVHNGSCKMPLKGGQIAMDIEPKPVRAMEKLTFRVTLTGIQTAANPFIDLGMPAMNMGRNRVRLTPDGNGVFTGQGIIVRCQSGRRTWFARITIPELEPVEFVFDVIY